MTPIERLAAAYPTLFEGTAIQWSDCPPGWETLVAALCARLVAEHPTVRCAQCKSKFGSLRFYVEEADEAAVALIRACEAQSVRLCEECGAPGETRPLRGRVTTACPEHAAERVPKT